MTAGKGMKLIYGTRVYNHTRVFKLGPVHMSRANPPWFHAHEKKFISLPQDGA